MRANRNISRTLPGPSVVSKPTPIFSWSRQTNKVTMHPHLANARPRLPRISPPKKSTEYSRCEGAFNQFPIRRMPRYPNPVGAWFAVARQTSVLLVIKKILACYVVCLRVVVSAVLLTRGFPPLSFPPWLPPLGFPPSPLRLLTDRGTIVVNVAASVSRNRTVAAGVLVDFVLAALDQAMSLRDC